jgi:two-component system, NarL family, response regulator
MGEARPLTVLLADDHPVVREGLRAVLDRRPDISVVAEACTGRQAVEEFVRHRPDIVLMDLRMPEMDGVDAISAILEQAPAAHVVVLTTYGDDEDVYRAMRAGAKGYLLKDAPRDELLECIHAVHAGRTLVSPAVAERLAEHLSVPELSTREMDVLRLIGEGRANKQIAAVLGVSEGTVKTHVNGILTKLGASDRTQAVTIALRRGILRLT